MVESLHSSFKESTHLPFPKFLAARHDLWLERTYGLKSDVTDSTLRSYRFTNIWRELDRGTVYLFNSVQKKFIADTTKLVCHSILYRLFNLPDPYERVLAEFGDSFYLDAKAEDLLSFINSLPVMYSAAYTRQVNMPKTCEQLVRLEPRALEIEKSLATGDPRLVRNSLLKVYSIGVFTADQLTMDLCWSGGPFSSANFSPSLGPGAKDGLVICKNEGYGENLILLAMIGENAIAEEKRPSVNGLPISFDMRALEHSLCEYSKYVKTYNNAVSGRAGKRVYASHAERPEIPYSWERPRFVQ